MYVDAKRPGEGVDPMQAPSDNGGRDWEVQKLTKSCQRLLWMARSYLVKSK